MCSGVALGVCVAGLVRVIVCVFVRLCVLGGGGGGVVILCVIVCVDGCGRVFVCVCSGQLLFGVSSGLCVLIFERERD